jgi:hypothetical protein
MQNQTNHQYIIACVAVVLFAVLGHFIFQRYRLFTYYSPEIESVLKMAGSNHRQLVKVLKHYGKNPSDSLKYRAAKFLIVNMPGKFSEYREGQWNDIASVNLRWTSSSNKQLILDTYKIGDLVKEADITHITAKYLINNIELAFKVWQEMPWGKDIPFDVFCEEILPHRVDTEPLENWREKVLASFADIYNSFKNDTNITVLEACDKVNSLLPRFRADKDFNAMNFSQLMASNRGLCDEMAMLGVFAMRGLGIPATFDFTPMWPYGIQGSSWNSVRDSNGKHHSFMGAQTNVGKYGTPSRSIRTYRQFYGKQNNVNPENIPPLLRHINNIVDVTSEYFGGFDIWFPIPKDYSAEKGPVYLAILKDMEWYPIVLGAINQFNLDFPSIRSELYLPMYYQNGVQIPIGFPFKYGYRHCHFYSPQSSYTKSFTGIAPSGNVKLHQMTGGKFEVANCSDFSDARTIYTIKTSGPGYHTVSVKHTSAYRYIRYVSPVGGRCNVSILEFYDENNEKLQGTATGTPGANAKMTHDRVFDGDVDTFFEAASDDDHSWVGLDLGKSRQITKIRYLPRTDGNGIYEGHVYELFYWNGNEWYSLGSQTADSHILQYKVPFNALFYLKNVTKDRMHNNPFIVESGAQQWFF